MPALIKQPTETADRRQKSRRKHPRALVDWPVTVISSKATHQGKAENISRGGALIHLEQELDVGDSVRLAFEVPDYQDVIVAKGEILRTFPLRRGVEQKYSHGIALQFTEISDDNLKFFTGNLAPEWRDGYEDNGPIQLDKRPKNYNKYTHYLLWTLVFIILVPTIYFLYSSVQKRLDIENSLTEIYGRLLIIEEQINSVENSLDSFETFESKINDLQVEVSRFKNNMPETEVLENINLQLSHQNLQINNIYDKIENLEATKVIGSDLDQQKQKKQYYVVRKGDNLYQISSKNGITIRELKEINSLNSNDEIFPGQKLMLK